MVHKRTLSAGAIAVAALCAAPQAGAFVPPTLLAPHPPTSHPAPTSTTHQRRYSSTDASTIARSSRSVDPMDARGHNGHRSEARVLALPISASNTMVGGIWGVGTGPQGTIYRPQPHKSGRDGKVVEGERVKGVAWPRDEEAAALRESLFTEEDMRPVILFDGDCGFCSGVVNMIMTLDGGDPVKGSFRFASLQGETGQSLLKTFGMDTEHFTSIVIVDASSAYTKSDACLRIAQGLKKPIAAFAGVAAHLPTALRDVCYEAVSAQRHMLGGGEMENCEIPSEEQMQRFLDM